MSPEQYATVLAACQGKDVTRGTWGPINGDGAVISERLPGPHCPLGWFLIENRVPCINSSVVSSAARALDATRIQITSFIDGVDGNDDSDDDPWYLAGARMRKELGL